MQYDIVKCVRGIRSGATGAATNILDKHPFGATTLWYANSLAYHPDRKICSVSVPFMDFVIQIWIVYKKNSDGTSFLTCNALLIAADWRNNRVIVCWFDVFIKCDSMTWFSLWHVNVAICKFMCLGNKTSNSRI